MRILIAIGAMLGVTVALIAPRPRRHAAGPATTPEEQAVAAHLAAMTPSPETPTRPPASGAARIRVYVDLTPQALAEVNRRRRMSAASDAALPLLERTLAGLRALPVREGAIS